MLLAVAAALAWAPPGGGEGGAAACTMTARASDPGTLHALADALASALDGRRRARSDADVVVCLEPGVHSLAGRPLRLRGAAHNHPRGGRVIWTTRDARADATISGGAALTKWSRCAEGHAACAGAAWHDVWVHAVADVPHATAATVPFRQLWVDGVRAPRVTTSGAELGLETAPRGYVVSDTVAAKAVDGSWAANEVEMRWPSQIQNWIEPRCIVADVAPSRAAAEGNGTAGAPQLHVSPRCWSALIARNGDALPPPPLLVENVLRPPPRGQFVATRDYVFYTPRAHRHVDAPRRDHAVITPRSRRDHAATWTRRARMSRMARQ